MIYVQKYGFTMTKKKKKSITSILYFVHECYFMKFYEKHG